MQSFILGMHVLHSLFVESKHHNIKTSFLRIYNCGNFYQYWLLNNAFAATSLHPVDWSAGQQLGESPGGRHAVICALSWLLLAAGRNESQPVGERGLMR